MTCAMELCKKSVAQKGWCWAHYTRWRRYGDPAALAGRRGPADPAERLASKTDRTGDCWLWTGRLRPDGYAQISVEGKHVLAHRFAWYIEYGSYPPNGLSLDHLCSVRHCLRPSHLEAVTHAENVRRGRAARVAGDRMLARTHCKHGHPWDEVNTRIAPCNGKRVCRACEKARR